MAERAARLRAQLQAEGSTWRRRADPVEQFRAWHAIWQTVCDDEPYAMIVATADAAGRPSARNVLLRDLDERGFVFFTNYESRKGQDLSVNAAASLVFSWVPIGRQVVVLGRAERCSAAESDAYFATRPRASQVSAWASDQSREVADRSVLEERHRTYEAEFEGRRRAAPATLGRHPCRAPVARAVAGPSRPHARSVALRARRRRRRLAHRPSLSP